MIEKNTLTKEQKEKLQTYKTLFNEMKSLDTYDSCLCGSGKKYKWCCMNSVKNHTWGFSRFELMNGSVFNPTEPEKIMGGYLEKVLYIPYYNSLPSNIVNEIDELIKKYPIRSNGCIKNSLLLTLNIEGVETCKGYYSDDFETHFSHHSGDEDYCNDLKQLISDCEENGCRFFNYDDEKVYDVINERVYYFHFWNVYNGIHFDITRELSEKYYDFKDFMGYDIERTLSYEDLINPKTTQSTFLSNKDTLSGELSGSGIYGFLFPKHEIDLRPQKYLSEDMVMV